MTARPFLSHKREDADDLGQLRNELGYSGAAGWQDVRDLPLGRRFLAWFSHAIDRDTTGFIWWGTALSLGSTTICGFEIPRALRRSRRRRKTYPVVPLFVDLEPGRDRELLEDALGDRAAKRLLDLQGLVRSREESLEGFARRAARRYVKDSLRGLGEDPLRVEITTAREPTLNGDLSIDWRGLVKENGDPRSEQALARMVISLSDIRAATQAEAHRPHICVEPHVRVPLGALIGWEWNRVRPVRLDILQPAPDGSTALIREGDYGDVPLPEADVKVLGKDGPVVVAASVGIPLDGTLARYAARIQGRRIVHLHVPLENGRFLEGSEINSLARWVVDQLGHANDEGGAKHLILAGPVGLAVRVGAMAHGKGACWIPLWDGGSSYSGGLEIGGSSAGPGLVGPEA
jgi:TIR domain